MSRQDVLKAELKARRSSRELEQGLDHLVEKVEVGVTKANELKSRATEKAQDLKARATSVAGRVTHPKDTLLQFVGKGTTIVNERATGLARTLASSAKTRYETTSPRSLQIAAGIFATGIALVGIFFYRRRRFADAPLLSIAAEQERRARLLGTTEEDLLAS